MPIIGAVLSLSPLDAPYTELREALARDTRLTLGEVANGRLPVVVETRSHEEDRAYLDALRSMPGVLDVQVAFNDFSDLHESGSLAGEACVPRTVEAQRPLASVDPLTGGRSPSHDEHPDAATSHPERRAGSRDSKEETP